VAQPQEKTADQSPELPNPELNPLLNPTLGQNLGRWAHVYFTSPPEKREQAVLDLLHELQAEGAGGAAPRFGPSEASEEAQVSADKIRCAECGHENGKQQRFCGMCGSSLVLDDEGAPKPAPRILPADEPQAMRNEPDLLTPETQSMFGTSSLFRSVDPPSQMSTEDTDLQWLRDGALRESSAGRTFTKYAFALLVILAGAFFYMQSHSQKPQAPNPTKAAVAAPTSQSPNPPAAPDSSIAPATAGSEASPKSPAESAATPAAQTQTPPPESAQPRANSTQNPPAVPEKAQAGAPEKPSALPATSSPGTGLADLTTADGYLTGKYGHRDSAEAAKFLWRAVGKGNITAALVLSDLYMAGDGVAKSCDQARMLLDSAAQRNSAQAADKLRQLQRQGCP
jgi:hypothetical protein